MTSNDNPKRDVNQEFFERTQAGSEASRKEEQLIREEELQKYHDSEKIAHSILEIITLYPEITMNKDRTLNEKAIRRLLLDPSNLENPIAWGKEREEYIDKNPDAIWGHRGDESGIYHTFPLSIWDLNKWDSKLTSWLPYRKKEYEEYKRFNNAREIAENFINIANDQIESNGKVTPDYVTSFIESYNPDSDKPTSDSSSNETKTSKPFGGDSSEDASSPSGNDRALSTLEESLFRIASEANDIVDRMKELYNEVYDGRGISSAEERAQPGWEPSYLDKQFDLRIMDIEEQSKSRNRALILTMAGIDLRGEMEEARKLISFKTKELRDIGHDPDGFRRTQYQKQSQFLLQSFGLLMQIAPNAFGAKYGISQNAWALSNGIDPRSITNLGNQYGVANPISLAVPASESGEQ